MHELHEAVAANVRKYRTALGMTRKELAEKAYVSVETVKCIEIGRRGGGRPTQVSLDTAARLAIVLGVTLDRLVETADGLR